jgi:hypothetical protein
MKAVSSLEINELIVSMHDVIYAPMHPPELDAIKSLPEVQDMARNSMALLLMDPIGTSATNIAVGMYFGLLIQQARAEKEALEKMVK